MRCENGERKEKEILQLKECKRRGNIRKKMKDKRQSKIKRIEKKKKKRNGEGSR